MARSDSIPRRKLGNQGLEVSAIGLGCAALSGQYNRDDIIADDNAVNLIHQAFTKGVTLFDTSEASGPYTHEVLLGKALKGLPREKIQIATKFEVFMTDTKMIVRGDPQYVRKACENSLRRFDIEYIDLYYQHRVDPKTPIEATMGELKKLVEEGQAEIRRVDRSKCGHYQKSPMQFILSVQSS